MTTTDLVPVEITTSITPADFAQSMNDAVAKAKTFTEIVESQKLYTKIGNGKHLHVEAWQTIAMGYGLTPGIKSSEILYDEDGREIGAKSTSVIYDANGTIRGDFGASRSYNLVHGSDSPESAETEIALYFSPDELLDYVPDASRWVFVPNDV